jgi:deoxyribodipyrimidine photo-lyase
LEAALLWFRRDLRLRDNPALSSALANRQRLIPVFVHAPDEHGAWPPGAASNCWLHHSLTGLAADLAKRGSRLIVRCGPSIETITHLARQCGARRVYWNRCYEPALRVRDNAVQTALDNLGIRCCSFNGSLLYEPWSLQTRAGQPYRVFSRFWAACQQRPHQSEPLPAPDQLPAVPPGLQSIAVDDLQLLPRARWHEGLMKTWTVGERAAAIRLERFLSDALKEYSALRDRPDMSGTSRLSAHLHFGELSPRQVCHAIDEWQAAAPKTATVRASEDFLRELGWREFAYHLLYHFPQTPDRPLDSRFERFPWSPDYTEAIWAWQGGQTGYPIIDAGMRELWSTGWMHNRVRMIVASFLVKNLRVPWGEGARWFWDTLLDADLANNTLGWQWSAGCGADSAPYFRIFNPVVQGQRFDPAGNYVRKWVPALAALPAKTIHQPWATSANALSHHGIVLDRDYPLPLVDLRESRRLALEAFQSIKNRGGESSS